jgi:phospholipase C
MLPMYTITHILHTYYTHTTHILHTYYTHTTHILHTYYTHTTHILHTYYTHTTHILHTYYTHNTHILHTYYTHTTHILHTYYTHTTHILHTYYTHIAQGRHDAWNTARDPGMGMAYFSRADLPYYYALYDGFTAADQYFQSTFTATNPNRMFLFAGSNGLSAGESAVLSNSEPRPGYTWSTMGEVLEEAGVSWKVYQQVDNFDDNAFAWFANYQAARPGDPLFDKGMYRSRSVIDSFEADVAAGTLPQVHCTLYTVQA